MDMRYVEKINMDDINALALIALAGLIHASFQLSVSTLTLLSGHAIGAKTSRRRLLKLISGFTSGTVLMTALLLSGAVLWTQLLFKLEITPIAWASTCGFLIGLSLAIWIFYYRKGPGTSLWLPRGMARYLLGRTKATSSSAEALGLGMTSVVAELLFIAGPIAVTGLLLFELKPLSQLAGLSIYLLVSLLPFLFVAGRIAGGHSIAAIQRWRSANKGFLQFIAGLGLIVLAFCVYVSQLSESAAIMESGLYQ